MKLTRTHKLLYVVILAALALTAVLPAFAQSAQAHERPNIVEIAASNPDFSTLVAAVQKAGLVDALDGPKRVTVFAPTNDAFDDLAAQLGYNNGMALVNALSAEDLTPILLYHVTNGNRSLKTLFPPQSVRMLSGELAETTRSGGMRYIDGQPIVASNIRASNGFIHVIGGVMLP